MLSIPTVSCATTVQEKQSRKNNFLGNNRKRILFTGSAFVLMYLVAYVIDPYSSQWQGYFDRSSSDMAWDWGTSLLISLCISESSITIGRQLNEYIPWTDKPLVRLAVETNLNLIVVLLINFIVTVFCVYMDEPTANAVLSPEEARGMIQWVVTSVIISFMIMGINIGNYLIVNWKNEALRVAELNQLAIESELQSLKLQIDPHFVFNNLSVLSELILEDQQVGYNYAESFARIYRYLLVNAKKDIIPLEDELSFLDSYMYLIENRLGGGVIFRIDVNPEHWSLYMPPLTLQMLVENALKHNQTNKKNPLEIRIYSQKNSLVVANKLLPVGKIQESSGIGISNIIRRYKLLSQEEPTIENDHKTFRVTVPLIKL
jgi:hypothetical protein